METETKPLRLWAQGLRYGLPVMLGYAPVSFAFAVAAVGSGLPWPLVLAISVTNFASAGQAAGAGLLVNGAMLPEIGITVFIINVRYLLMSLGLSQKVENMSLGKRLLLAFGITDEIFFLAMNKEGALSGWFFAGLVMGPYSGWVLGTLAGALAGAVLPASLSAALGIALYAMFIAIIMPAMRQSNHVVCVVALAVLFSCLFHYVPGLRLLPGGWALIVSAVTASVIGALRFPVIETGAAS